MANYFLRLDGIQGESQAAKHAGEIDIESFSWGEAMPITTGGGGGQSAGKVSMQDVTFVARTSKATPDLFQSCASGKHIPSALLTVAKASKDLVDFLTWRFDEVLVTSFQTGGSAQGEVVPIDQFSLNFAKITISYRAQRADGTLDTAITRGWDKGANKAV